MTALPTKPATPPAKKGGNGNVVSRLLAPTAAFIVSDVGQCVREGVGERDCAYWEGVVTPAGACRCIVTSCDVVSDVLSNSRGLRGWRGRGVSLGLDVSAQGFLEKLKGFSPRLQESRSFVQGKG